MKSIENGPRQPKITLTQFKIPGLVTTIHEIIKLGEIRNLDNMVGNMLNHLIGLWRGGQQTKDS